MKIAHRTKLSALLLGTALLAAGPLMAAGPADKAPAKQEQAAPASAAELFAWLPLTPVALLSSLIAPTTMVSASMAME